MKQVTWNDINSNDIPILKMFVLGKHVTNQAINTFSFIFIIHILFFASKCSSKHTSSWPCISVVYSHNLRGNLEKSILKLQVYALALTGKDWTSLHFKHLDLVNALSLFIMCRHVIGNNLRIDNTIKTKINSSSINS